VHEAVLARVTESAASFGLVRVAMTPSPITGATGNVEFLIHLRPDSPSAGSMPEAAGGAQAAIGRPQPGPRQSAA